MTDHKLEPLWLRTQLGQLQLHWHPESLADYSKTMTDLIEECERKNNHLGGLRFGAIWQEFYGLLVSGLQDAIIQAQREFEVVVRARILEERSQRNQLLRETASQAQLASEKRLRSSSFSFPASDLQRTPTPRERFEDQLAFRLELFWVICDMLREEKKRPTLSNVARRVLPRTQQNTLSGNDTGKASLSRKLKAYKIDFKNLVAHAEVCVGREKVNKVEK